MPKRPKEKWQIEVRTALDERGITYKDLADIVGASESSIRQVMCKDNMPGVKSKMCHYLGVEI